MKTPRSWVIRDLLDRTQPTDPLRGAGQRTKYDGRDAQSGAYQTQGCLAPWHWLQHEAFRFPKGKLTGL